MTDRLPQMSRLVLAFIILALWVVANTLLYVNEGLHVYAVLSILGVVMASALFGYMLAVAGRGGRR